ncbi:beta-glucanase [Vibrio sinaloensis]|uniref:glycoside hydrolase family 16 protein n=1 Tax=Photobacterium sp. (strain ATCC 43367) TaxID=379097 RepID=UPI00057C39F6|nr:glycoside hydrolase family 16 protein [Vibrio sinaloensis]KIE21901.1 beta-glucanase [Vibrio sinaloensis]
MLDKTPITQLMLAAIAGSLIAGCASTADTPDASFITGKKPVILKQETITPSEKWQLAWQDNFDGERINPRNWSFEQNCWGGGNNEQQCYTDREQNAFVKDGFLHIVARKESFTGPDNPDGVKGGATKTLPYTSARLRTKGKRDQKYGRFEIRAKLPSGQGTWPAIWMLPTQSKYGTWAASGEIDILEAVNLNTQSDAPGAKPGDAENRIHATLHYGKAWPDNVHSGLGVTLPNGINPADDFHTYAIEWEEGEIRWYVDNIHYATQTHEGWYAQYEQDGQLVNADTLAPFNEKFHLLLNVAVGGSWAANANEKGVNSDIFPQTMLVDYVKVYRCSVDRWKGKGCAATSENATLVKGNQPPAILVQDDSYANGPELIIFEDSLNTSLAYGSYDPTDIVEHAEVDEPSRGKVLSISKLNGGGNLYFRSPKTDLSSWLESGVLSFDVKVESIGAGVELVVKMDSGWPATSDITVPLDGTSDWQTISIPVADIIAGGNRYASGSADPSNINNLLVFEPTGEMSILLDNIRMTK